MNGCQPIFSPRGGPGRCPFCGMVVPNVSYHREYCRDAPKNERARRRILGESFRSQDNAAAHRESGEVGGCNDSSDNRKQENANIPYIG